MDEQSPISHPNEPLCPVVLVLDRSASMKNFGKPDASGEADLDI